MQFIRKLPEGKEFFVTASGNSMIPQIAGGDRIKIKKTDFEQIKTGDVILYFVFKGKKLVIHRVIKISKGDNGENYFLTKGDNNQKEDAWTVTKKNFLGVVIRQKSPLQIFSAFFRLVKYSSLGKLIFAANSR